MKYPYKIYILYLIALVVPAVLYLTLDGKADVVGHNQYILYAINLFVVVIPAVSLFFSYSWESLSSNKKRFAQTDHAGHKILRRRFSYIKIAFFIFSLWSSTLCYLLAQYATNTKYGILVALLHGILVFPKFSFLKD